MADVSIAPATAGDTPATAAASVQVWLLAGAAMVLMLIAPALWNGFPLIFPDTSGYFTRPIEGTLAMGRSALYGWFLYLGIPLAFWPVIVAQAAAMAWVLVLSLRAHGLGGRPWLAIGLTALLTLLTSTPWFAAQLMPDILFPIGVLAVHLLAFRTAQLRTPERIGLAALVAIAIASHMAALGLCIAIVGAFWLLAPIRRLALPVPRLSWAGSATAAGVALCLLSNALLTGHFAFTPGGSSFLFGRLIEDGIAERYLNERCPDVRLRICAYQNELPGTADDWLWENGTPFYKLGGWEEFGPEARRIIIDSIRRYPLMHAKAAILATAEQFASFATEVSIEDNEPTHEGIQDHVPALFDSMMLAKQQAEPFDVAPLNVVHVPVGAVSIAGLMVALIFRRRLNVQPEVAALCLTVLIALAMNAAICGVFSHPVDRYQSRLVLLAPFVLALTVIARRRHIPQP